MYHKHMVMKWTPMVGHIAVGWAMYGQIKLNKQLVTIMICRQDQARTSAVV